MESYAQNFEDVILWRALKFLETGFYIDLGAWHPIRDSVTKIFYDAGWAGINVDADTDCMQSFEKLRSRDTNICALLGPDNVHRKFYSVYNADGEPSGLSTLDELQVGVYLSQGFRIVETVRECQTVSRIFNEHAAGKEIHFLKIDVEGSEKAILENINLTIFRPWIILVESVVPRTNKPNYANWQHLLTKAGYYCVYDDSVNRFYLSEECLHLQTNFHYPPNIFDGFDLRLNKFRQDELLW